MESHRYYPVVGPGDKREPDYERVARTLTDAELEEEILGRRGDARYQLVLIQEAERRGQAPPGEE